MIKARATRNGEVCSAANMQPGKVVAATQPAAAAPAASQAVSDDGPGHDDLNDDNGHHGNDD